MDLVLVGALPKNIEDLVRENFDHFQSGDSKKVEFPRNLPLHSARILHTSAPELYNLENPKQSSAQLNIGLVAPTEADEDSSTINMLANILGGDANSRLFINLSQRKNTWENTLLATNPSEKTGLRNRRKWNLSMKIILYRNLLTMIGNPIHRKKNWYVIQLWQPTPQWWIVLIRTLEEFSRNWKH